jgi:Na+/H+-dicarboxylate symporter
MKLSTQIAIIMVIGAVVGYFARDVQEVCFYIFGYIVGMIIEKIDQL